MEEYNDALEKLAKGNIDALSANEKTWLLENLDTEDLSIFHEVIQKSLKVEEQLSPSPPLKLILLEKFRETNNLYNNKGIVELVLNKKVKRYKFMAISMFTVCFILSIYLLNTTKESDSTAFLDAEDFNRFTQIDIEVFAEDSLTNDTKYLMSMDFFSNNSLSID